MPGAHRVAVACAAALTLAAGTSRADDGERAAARLLARWAPVVVQHVAPDDGGQDRPTRLDFDGDWIATNNWEHLAAVGVRAPAVVYGAAILTETHAYLTYTLFYPRDWARPACAPRVCHENDLEVLLLVVDRRGPDAGDAAGALLLAEAKAHRRFVSWRGAAVGRDAGGRPRVAVEAYGHGLRACGHDDPGCAPADRRIVYAPGDEAGLAPAHPRGERVPYRLLALREALWARRALDAEGAALWDRGREPPIAYAGVAAGRAGRAIGKTMASSRFGAAARPPWGVRGPAGARGDWFLDPATAVLERLSLPGAGDPGARRYVHNPYLDDLRRECQGGHCPPPPPDRARRWALLYLALAGAMAGGLLRVRRRSRPGA